MKSMYTLKLVKGTATVILSIILAMSWVNTAQAIPAFAAKYDKVCSYCHNAWPQLNKKGREFKELGYRLPKDLEEKKIADILNEGIYPISGLLIARPYDNKKSGHSKLRAMHEIELIIAGLIGNKWSGFFEIEAEDETGFAPEVGPGVLTYHYSRSVNVQMAYATPFFSDAYGFIGDAFRLTRGHVGFIDQKFGEADAAGKIRDSRQTFNISGRPVENLFYIFGISGVKGDAEGEEASIAHGRVALEPSKDFMFGLFALDGEDKGTKRKFSRIGLDLQSDIKNTRLQAAYVTAKDDDASTPSVEVKNKAFSVQAYHTVKTKEGKPTWVPIIRYDSYEKNDGTDKYDELTLNLTYYIEQNVKAYLEFWRQIDVPDGVENNNRLTAQVYVAF